MGRCDPLPARLFGYGGLYAVQRGISGELKAVPTDAPTAAAGLAAALAALVGGGAAAAGPGDSDWHVSMPFGRCGLAGLPREHLRVCGPGEARLEWMDVDGTHSELLGPGRTACLVPGRVARLWVRPAPGRRALVAFQTEDRTPLQGNAAPFTLDGIVPEHYGERLRVCHAAFERVWSWAAGEPHRYREALARFFTDMEARIGADAAVAATQAAARATGTYDVADQEPLFARQQALLTADVVARIGAGAEELFRFPGMFGGVATLYRLLPAG